MSGRFPNFLIPGAGKSATSSLAYYLGQHPDVFVANPKEPTFFTYAGIAPCFNGPDQFHKQMVTSLDAYLALFDGVHGYKAVGEASTYYFMLYEQTIDNIRRLVPDYENLRIIIILRNPIERAFSNYKSFRMVGLEDLLFESAIENATIEWRARSGWSPSYDYLREGLYYERVKAYMDNFPRTRVYLYEDLVLNVDGLVADIFAFLNVESGFRPDLGRKLNLSVVRRSKVFNKILHGEYAMRRMVKGSLGVDFLREAASGLVSWADSINTKQIKMKETTRVSLVNYYRRDIKSLAGLIGRNLSEWIADEKR